MEEYSWDDIFRVHCFFVKNNIGIEQIYKHLNILENRHQIYIHNSDCFAIYWSITGKTYKESDIESPIDYSIIRFLFLQALKLEEIYPVRLLENLEFIDCSYNQIDSIWPLKNLISLEKIIFKNNLISSLRHLKNLENLEEIDFEGNKIFEALSNFRNLLKLKKLNLSYNSIPWGVIGSHPTLEYLDLCGNKYATTGNLEQLKTLKELDIRHTEISLSDACILKRKLKQTKIYHISHQGDNIKGEERSGHVFSVLNGDENVDFFVSVHSLVKKGEFELYIEAINDNKKENLDFLIMNVIDEFLINYQNQYCFKIEKSLGLEKSETCAIFTFKVAYIKQKLFF